MSSPIKAHAEYEEGPYYNDDEYEQARNLADSNSLEVGDTVVIWEGDASPVDWGSYAPSYDSLIEKADDDDVVTEHMAQISSFIILSASLRMSSILENSLMQTPPQLLRYDALTNGPQLKPLCSARLIP